MELVKRYAPQTTPLVRNSVAAFAFVFACVQGALAQQTIGLAHAAIRVADVPRSVAFYNKLGYQQAFGFDKDGKPSQVFVKVNDRQFLEIYAVAEGEKPEFLHLCYEGKGLKAVQKDFAAKGLDPKEVKKARAGNLLFTMVGPEKQNIEYTEYMPGSLHSADAGKHLGTERLSSEIAAISLGMNDVPAAHAFYVDKMKFPAAKQDPNSIPVPDNPSEAVLFEPLKAANPMHLWLRVADGTAAAKALAARGLQPAVTKAGVSVTDPDGNIITFTTRR